MDYERICQTAVKSYGSFHQTLKAMEEMGELTTALVKFKDGRVDYESVIDEIADATIMMFQLSLIFDKDKVEDRINEKLKRLEMRLKTEDDEC